jgi:outer membrane protein OmpA-like peptidoglycan-associated protein
VRAASRWAALALAALLLPACSDERPEREAPSAAASSTAAAASQPYLSRVVSFYGPNEEQRTVRLDVHPAVRVEQGLLVLVDLMGEGSDEPAGSDYFCTSRVVCSDFGAASLVDADALVRYGPLRDGTAEGDVLSSEIPYELGLGVRHRAGVLFPEPDGSPTTIDLHLQYGGTVLDLPVTDDEPPAGLLVDGAGSSPDADAAEGDDVLLPLPDVTGAPYVDRHPLIAKVVGGDVGEGGSATQGVVSLAADVLFEFDAATLTPASQAVVREAAQILADKADPSQPVEVTGYTDAKGSDAYNADLSQRRAQAVADALTAHSGVAALTLRPIGRGAADPVAPNARPDGADDPQGRALNRRVELSYTPQAPVTVPTADPGPTGGAAAGASDVTLQADEVIASGAGGVPMTAVVQSVRTQGRLSLLEVLVTPGESAAGVDYFGRARNERSLGAWRLLVPTTGAAHVPATDEDDPDRVLGTTVKQMNAGRDYLLSVWTAAVPAEVERVDVDLGQLGIARGVPVTG